MFLNLYYNFTFPYRYLVSWYHYYNIKRIAGQVL